MGEGRELERKLWRKDEKKEERRGKKKEKGISSPSQLQNDALDCLSSPGETEGVLGD